MNRSGIRQVFGKKWVDFHRVVAIDAIKSCDYQGLNHWRPGDPSLYCQVLLTVEMLDKPVVVSWGERDFGAFYGNDSETLEEVAKFDAAVDELVRFWKSL